MQKAHKINQPSFFAFPATAGPKASDVHMTPKCPCVYILASQRNGTLYVGATSDIARRAFEHRLDTIDGFTHKCSVHMLVFMEFHETMGEAFPREMQIKKWRRAWKLALIDATIRSGAIFLRSWRFDRSPGSPLARG